MLEDRTKAERLRASTPHDPPVKFVLTPLAATGDSTIEAEPAIPDQSS